MIFDLDLVTLAEAVDFLDNLAALNVLFNFEHVHVVNARLEQEVVQVVNDARGL